MRHATRRAVTALGPRATARLSTALASTTNQIEAVRLFMVEVCRAMDLVGGVFYVVDPSATRHLTPICQTYVEGRVRGSILVALANRRPARDLKGIGGRVVDTGRPAWVDDVVEAPNVHVPTIAQAAGIRGAIAVPVYQADRLAAVVEFFADRRLRPSAALMHELGFLGRVAGQRILDLPPGTLHLGR